MSTLVHSERQEVFEDPVVLVVDVEKEDRSREDHGGEHLKRDRNERESGGDVEAPPPGALTGIPAC